MNEQHNFWQTLSIPWKTCLDEAWQAYRGGSLPIGAAITNANSDIVARGRNRIFDKQADGEYIYNSRTAHAEINALINLNESLNPTGTCTLYTTMEPCPMCLGAIRISRMKACHYASRDPIAGSSALIEATPFMREPGIKMVPPSDPMLENILAAMFIEKLHYANAEAVIKSIAIREEAFPKAGKLARQLFKSEEMQTWAQTDTPTPKVVNILANRL
jgi:tRNA(adenine34) deaminase